MKSPFWYLLPAFLGIIGGVIAYAILKNDDPQKAKRALIIGLIITIPIFAGIRLAAASGTSNPFYVVATSGMIPVLQVYDIIIIQGHEPFEEVQVGDIIVFDRPSDHNRVIVSRVQAILDEDPKIVRTQGDANPTWIRGQDYPITEEEYIGKVAYIIPQVGYITQILKPPMNYIVIVMYVGIILGVIQSKHQKFKKISNSEASTLFYYECPKCHSGDIQNNPDGSVNCPSCGYRG
jgi:signal peptidase